MRRPFDGNFPITQTFGNDLVINGVHIYGQWGLKGHNGIDYGLPTGTPLLAPHGGKILEAYFDAAGYGNYIKIEDDVQGSVLGHMMSFSVKIGDIVKEGQQIGISDNTGNSTGPHLHWGYYRFPRDRNNGYNGYIDQTSYIVTIPYNPPPTPVNNTIADFLISKGYAWPEAHLNVVKTLYDSDQKLKSGNYILKTDSDKEKLDLTKSLQVDFNNKYEILKQTLDEDFNLAKKKWDAQESVDIKLAVDNAIMINNQSWQTAVNDCVKIKDTSEYKFALWLYKLTHKGGEK